MILLDTHALIWCSFAEHKLGRSARLLIDRHWDGGGVSVSAVSFWEAGLLAKRGRIVLPSAAGQWRRDLLDSGLNELPLTGEIALRTLDLSGLPDDPADRFITATALVHNAILLTADERILNWRHSLERVNAAE